MAFQGIFEVRGQINQLAELEGSKIVGTKISAPISVHKEVYVLPMDNVLETKVSFLPTNTVLRFLSIDSSFRRVQAS